MPRKKREPTEAAPQEPQQGMQDIEQRVREFAGADEHYRLLQEKFVSGDVLPELFMVPGAIANGQVNWDIVKTEYRGIIQDLRDALEERNARLKNAQDALRQKVALAPTKWRGPEGKPTLLDVGPFKVSSVTYRGFDPQSLFDLCQKRGVYERLMELRTLDKDGKEKKLVEQTWDIDFPLVLDWLKHNGMQEVIDGAYDETESTPQVKGPKRLAFLGETKEK